MELNGTYLGFSPTDESGVGYGELEVVINDDTISYRFATGLEIKEEDMERSLLRQMPHEELKSRFLDDADLTGLTGYMIGDDGPIFIFSGEGSNIPEDSPHVTVLRFVSEEIDGIFGPTPLFTPKQVEAGYFDKALEAIEAEQGDPGVVPRLSNGGERLERSTS